MAAIGVGRRWVLRFWPAKRQARRWESRNRFCKTITALQRRSGLRRLPLHCKVRQRPNQLPLLRRSLRREPGLVEFNISE